MLTHIPPLSAQRSPSRPTERLHGGTQESKCSGGALAIRYLSGDSTPNVRGPGRDRGSRRVRRGLDISEALGNTTAIVPVGRSARTVEVLFGHGGSDGRTSGSDGVREDCAVGTVSIGNLRHEFKPLER